MAVAVSNGASAFFSDSYAEARGRFLSAAREAGAEIASRRNPAQGPAGEELFTDAAWLGPHAAERVLVTISGTHGAEGFCGSAIQTGSLASGLWRTLPPGTAMLAIHALNPHGFAWMRRVNEGNVDLNRNYVDHAGRHPVNPGYEALRDAICPAQWDEATLLRCNAAFDAFAADHGSAALASALTSGQYSDPAGVFYGGTEPVWSRRTLTDILQRHCGHARHVAVIDLHSGFGPYGYGEIMNDHGPAEAGYARINDWFGGEATTFYGGTSSYATTTGSTVMGVTLALPRAEVSEITLEYGTVPFLAMVEAVRADNWLHLHGDVASDQGKAIKRQVRATFYPDGDEWKRLVFERAIEVQRRMANGLGAA